MTKTNQTTYNRLVCLRQFIADVCGQYRAYLGNDYEFKMCPIVFGAAIATKKYTEIFGEWFARVDSLMDLVYMGAVPLESQLQTMNRIQKNCLELAKLSNFEVELPNISNYQYVKDPFIVDVRAATTADGKDPDIIAATIAIPLSRKIDYISITKDMFDIQPFTIQ